MKKLAIIGNSETPSKLLELFRKMTPGSSGIWKNLQGVDNLEEADYYAVIDWLPPNLGVDESKCIFLGAHPEGMQSYRDMSNYKGLKMYDCKHTFGFLEWWIKYDYDFLSNLKPPTKKKFWPCAIVSNASSQSYHKKRIEFLERFSKRMSDNFVDGFSFAFSLHGRIVPTTEEMKHWYRGPVGSADGRGFAACGNDHMTGKEEVLLDHEYIVEFDANGENYFSERVADDMLLWCMPIYWGGSGVHKYLPEKSFRYFDINGDGDDVMKIVSSDFYNKNLTYLAEARNLILNKYQFWPRVHEAIFNE